MSQTTIHNNHLKKYAYSDQMGYMQWHEWAGRMSQLGLRQKKCPECGLFKIWYKPKKDTK